MVLLTMQGTTLANSCGLLMLIVQIVKRVLMYQASILLVCVIMTHLRMARTVVMNAKFAKVEHALISLIMLIVEIQIIRVLYVKMEHVQK